MSQNVDESDSKEDYPSQLRDSLRFPILLKLLLQLPCLTVIPRIVFEHMPLLEVLDLSSTSIQSLPSSISCLSSLNELLLRDCSFLIELPIEIGMLTKLKMLDMEGSEIMYIPKEIVELTDLEFLRLYLSQYAEYYIKAKNVNGGAKVPRMMISKLKKLKELCISVCQEAEWWEKEIKEIQDEICDLENLEFLKWYLPTKTTLKQFLDIQINKKPAYEKLSNFTITIGQHAQLTSCLPRDLEKKFARFEKCLKWIDAEGDIYDISKIMKRAEALFLSRHWTIVNLSAFDVSKLKYFLLAECNEMETLVEIDDLCEIVENNKKSGLRSLEYLSIHYMGKLKSIWEGPIGKDSLSRLRILALHTCLELTTIFTPRIAQNLLCLVELCVEECPKVRSLISTPHSEHGRLFPSLERIFLLDLPELDHIFGSRIVLEKLESLMIYNCVKLRHLSEMELPRIQKIKGENKWWNSLYVYAPTWENVFEPLKEKSKLIKQLLEATNSLQHFHDVVSREAKDEKPLDGPGLEAQETKTDPCNFPLRKEEGLFHTLPEAKDEKPFVGSGLGAQETKTDPSNFPLRKERGLSHTLPDTSRKIEDSREFDVESSQEIDDALPWEVQCKFVEDIMSRLKDDDRACKFISCENLVVSLVGFLKVARDINDVKAQRVGCLLLLILVTKCRSIKYLSEDAYQLIAAFLDSEVIEEALAIMEELSSHQNCRSEIASSNALTYIFKFLDTQIIEIQTPALKILYNLTLTRNVRSLIVSSDLIPKLVTLSEDDSLSRYCLAILTNLCGTQDNKSIIAETDGCIPFIARVLESDSCDEQEQALEILVSLCSQSIEYCQLVIDEGVIPSVISISINGNDNGKSKAHEMLRLLHDIESEECIEECVPTVYDISKDSNSLNVEKKKSSKTSRILSKFSLISRRKA